MIFPRRGGKVKFKKVISYFSPIIILWYTINNKIFYQFFLQTTKFFLNIFFFNQIGGKWYHRILVQDSYRIERN